MISTLFEGDFNAQEAPGPRQQRKVRRQKPKTEEPPSAPLLQFSDLPDDCIVHMCAHFLRPVHVGHLAATCRRNMFVLDSNVIWRHQVERDHGLHWREWEKGGKQRDGPTLTITEEAMQSPGQYRKIYQHLERYQNILEADLDPSTERDALLKMLIIGDTGVGKTCLLRRFAHGQFDDVYWNTIGVDFVVKSVKTKSDIPKTMRVKLQLWDTAGRERFRTITRAYYRGTNAVLIAFSLADRYSFQNVKAWLGEVERYATSGYGTIVCMVGTKSDMNEKRQVSESEARELAQELGIQYFETSAKSGDGVERVFLSVASKALRKVIHRSDEQDALRGAAATAKSSASATAGQGWVSSVFSRITGWFK
eukprot:TRINITY_DN764_c0_g1_i1.p1 TRINITY_DN764_c0_g1~~TRINITY_DN764_c0_g1_i1.p1  ORF type:complete len:365 (+),score=46.33 TRINITY_DN764_c0_g1_i1:3249-4343(+)